MYSDIVDLREFYASPLGRVAARLLARQLGRLWPDLHRSSLLAFGYGTPLLQAMQAAPERRLLFMPATQGVAGWPREGANCACLVDEDTLPLPNGSIENILLLHALEGATNPAYLLRELWRVLAPQGRLLCIVPSRRGIWARAESTPFGNGEPYSPSQLKRLLRHAGFVPERTARMLYMPPSQSRLLLSAAEGWEKWGAILLPTFGGLLAVEASKQLYAPIFPAKQKKAALGLPLPDMAHHPRPVPSN
ncbi:MAG: methyltransferase domain-containing protein [Alphaproteobacteria bacterium]|nr:methyltransferase domain-containing protein [Alphaproteobacteria bacterium]